jgi:hypothetical protein
MRRIVLFIKGSSYGLREKVKAGLIREPESDEI